MQTIFNKFITKENFEKYLENKEKDDLVIEIIKALEVLVLNGKLKEIEHSEIHETNFTYSWTKFINGEISLEKDEDYLMRDIKQFIEKLIIFNVNEERTYKKATTYEDFIEFLNKGNIEKFATPEGECFNCGRHLSIKFKDWTGELLEFRKIANPKDYRTDYKKDSPLAFMNESDYFKADECFTDFVKIKDVEITEKEIIITDWFRIQEFNDVVEKDGNRFSFDIGTAKGRSEQFEHYLNLGFISISTLSGLTVYSSKDKYMANSFIFGRENYDAENESDLTVNDLKEEGFVNRGLRATTIIGKEKLIEIVDVKVQDIEKSKEIVNKYLEENKREVLVKSIQPGIYTLVFDNRIKDVSELLFPQNITNQINPKILMYPKQLSLDLQKTKKPKI